MSKDHIRPPMPLSDRTTTAIDRRVKNGIVQLASRMESSDKGIFRKGPPIEVSSSLKAVIGELVNRYREPQQSVEGEMLPHPDALAAQKGLMIGARIMHVALKPRDIKPYVKAETERLGLLADDIPKMAQGSDLAEVLRIDGGNLASRLLEWPPACLLIEPQQSYGLGSAQRAELYSNGVGHMLTHGYTFLTEQAYVRVQLQNFGIQNEFTRQANQWQSESFQITSADIPIGNSE